MKGKAYWISVIKDAPTTVVSEDVEIALRNAGYDYELSGDWNIYDEEPDEIGGPRGFMVISPAGLDTAKVKAELEKLDGAESCEVTVEEFQLA